MDLSKVTEIAKRLIYGPPPAASPPVLPTSERATLASESEVYAVAMDFEEKLYAESQRVFVQVQQSVGVIVAVSTGGVAVLAIGSIQAFVEAAKLTGGRERLAFPNQVLLGACCIGLALFSLGAAIHNALKALFGVKVDDLPAGSQVVGMRPVTVRDLADTRLMCLLKARTSYQEAVRRLQRDLRTAYRLLGFATGSSLLGLGLIVYGIYVLQSDQMPEPEATANPQQIVNTGPRDLPPETLVRGDVGEHRTPTTDFNDTRVPDRNPGRVTFEKEADK